MNQSYRNYEIILVDAGSTDGSVEYVRQTFPEIRIIECGRIGVGEAINIGIRKSLGEIISFDFNTDEYVFSNWLEQLVKQLKRYDYNIITGTTRLIYGTNLIDEAGVEIDFFGHGKKLGNRIEIDSFNLTEKPVTYVGSPTFHRRILKKIGFVDEDYYLYSEDLDFCFRARFAGIEVYYSPEARSYHQISGTTRKNIGYYEYFFRRAQIRFQILYFTPWRLTFSLLYTCFFLPSHSLLYSIIFPKRFVYYTEKLIAELRAIKWNVFNLRKTIKRRKDIHSWKKRFKSQPRN